MQKGLGTMGRDEQATEKIVNGIWHKMPRASASLSQKSWLQGAGSLTKRLEREYRCTSASLSRSNRLSASLHSLSVDTAPHSVEVQLLYEGVQNSWVDESACLGLSAGAPVWVREAVLQIRGEAIVVARSMTSLAASQGIWRKLRYLQTRPLATLLYDNVSITRSCFEYAAVGFSHPLARLVERSVSPVPSKCSPASFLARRSIFTPRTRTALSGDFFAPLLVTECLLERAFR